MGRRVPAEKRFWAKVEKTSDGCWLWQGAQLPKGYGSFQVGYRRWVGAHVFSYELHVGPVPEGLEVLHGCDNPQCVRPDHLEAGTHKKNMADMAARGRSTRGRKRPGTGPAGERNRSARLTASRVREIRNVRETEGLSLAALARRFGVSKSQAHNIVSGAQWKEAA
jgi:hypothetical protein